MTGKELRPCGTPAAARRHQRAGEKPCEACLEAQRGGPRKPVKVARCGTRSGYVAHRARGEDACPPCRAANAAYSRGQAPVAPDVAPVADLTDRRAS